jgi:SAM-dependent methyltransferase
MSSFDRPTDPDIAPSGWVVRFAPLIHPAGLVLDLACGHGRHTRHLLAQGYRVVAADIDTSELADLRGHIGLEIIEADLEAAGAWPFGDRAFDGIVITNYLHRPHFERLPDHLAPAGVLIIETFGAGNEQFGRPRNPDFLLQPGELLNAFARQLHVVAYEHGIETVPRPAVRQRLCAVRGSGPLPLPATLTG